MQTLLECDKIEWQSRKNIILCLPSHMGTYTTSFTKITLVVVDILSDQLKKDGYFNCILTTHSPMMRSTTNYFFGYVVYSCRLRSLTKHPIYKFKLIPHDREVSENLFVSLEVGVIFRLSDFSRFSVVNV